ncbi:MAG: hypothetical protein FD126_1447 [Elusimicrobia bacterium]|nr:MAG: hypothetical protein FD126_1447 [Elusimicrobiota bacterium]
MPLEDFLYRYKERGVVERQGQKYKKYVKVPLVRTKHRQVALYAVLVVLTALAVFAVVRRFAERGQPAQEAVE